MKFLRFKDNGAIKSGYIAGDEIVEIENIIDALNGDLKIIESQTYSFKNIEILPPVSPSKIVCVGLNYRDHAAELNMEIPEEPVLFLKPPSSVIGHEDTIVYPEISKQVDYEVELGVVISKKAKNVNASDAWDVIGGYTIVNDVTARDIQRKDGQWTRAKSFDTFCPLGPFIETEMDPHKQKISLRLNGKRYPKR